MASKKVIVSDQIGFHARTASIFAKQAGVFTSKIYINFGAKKANGKSMLAIMTLGVKSNNEVEISAEGDDASTALETLSKLVQNNFKL